MLITLFYVIIYIFCLFQISLTLILLTECLASVFSSQKTRNSNYWLNTSVTVLIPAHNEETVIGDTLANLMPQLKPTDNIIVIADNCCDRTSEVVKEKGVKVIERQNENLRGKGYALDFGLNHLKDNPPDVVIFVDADCLLEPNSIQSLTEDAIAFKQPVQGLYLMETPIPPSPKDQISAFAFKVKNLVRPLGLYNLNQPCLLTGTGMAFSWDMINQVNLASGEIVEDMKLGLDLAIASNAPRFCPSAKITGRLPQKQEAATTQRTRWEHGHLQTAINYVPLLIKEAIKQKRLDLWILALDLAIPPLSLFVSLSIGFTLICLLLAIFGETVLPFLLSAIASSLIFISIAIAWSKFGREELSLIDLLKIPLYILWKIPLYFKFLRKRESQWIRTERDEV